MTMSESESENENQGEQRAYIMPAAKTNWHTPQVVIDLVEKFDMVGLDPCWEEGCLVKPMRRFTKRDDGLIRDWRGYGTVFVNPPYDDLRRWCEKISMEGERGVEIIALLPSRTDTKAFQERVSKATCMCFWKGRLRFVGAKASAPFPSLLAYWGDRYDRFYEIFADKGVIA
jgi:site-specific DNA-methyltransferase (adenine-specific)